MRKIICGMIIALLTVSVFPLAFNIQLVKAAGDTIYIRPNGSVDPPWAPIWNVGNKNVYYTLTANITDSIVVERDNIVVYGAGHVLEGAGTGFGISLTGRSNVTIKSITIREFEYGIYLNGSSGNKLYANKITNSTYHGILLYSSSGNSISANTITNNGAGIMLYSYSNSNSISANTITNNGYGICLYFSSSNSMSTNTITNNTYVGIMLYSYSNSNSMSANTIANNYAGIALDTSSSNSISANTITNNNIHGIYLNYSSSNSMSANTITNNNYVGIYLYHSSSSNSVSANTITNNGYGICLYYSSSNGMSANTITNNNNYGIWLNSSSGNSMSANTITNNNIYGIVLSYSSGNSMSVNTITNNGNGIYLYNSSNNLIYHNNFVGNTVQATVSPLGYANTWDDGYPSGGNYWSNYTGIDLKKGPNQNVAGTDDIGDTPYTIDANNTDRYPLMNPWTPITNIASLVIRRPNNLTSYRTYSTTTDSWTGWNTLPRTTCDSPAATICNNELHMVIRSLDGSKLYHGYVNLANNMFSGWKLISSSTPSAPTLTSNGTVLCLVIRGADNRTKYRLYSFNPRSWGTWKTLARTTCDGAAAAMLGNNLHIVIRSLDGKTLWHIIVKPNVGIVRNWIKISGATPSKPALTANQTANKLYLVVRRSDNKINWRTYEADTWASWKTLPTGTTCDGPAATIIDNKLRIIIRSITGTKLYYGYITLATNAFSGWTTLTGSTPSTPTLTSQ